MSFARRLSRFATDVSVRRPALWRLFRGPVRRQFDKLAPEWDSLLSPGGILALERALDTLEPPRAVLDLGTGTGRVALALATRWPQARVVGVDMAPAMLSEARAKLPARVELVQADAAALPFAKGEFELVTLANMIPFFDELARVVAAGGAVVVSFSAGAETPIYVPFERLREALGARGFGNFEEFREGAATALLARAPDR